MRMKLSLTGDVEGLEAGMDILAPRLGLEFGAEGFPVRVEQRPGALEIAKDEQEGIIRYDQPIHFFRALGLFAEESYARSVFKVAEQPRFKTNGIMVDVSRNAVLTLDSLKRLLEMMAAMGLNMLMLYMEDTYALESYPYFGYMRGRYSQEELRECDAHAELLGIEVIPCIQTLAHLNVALKWNYGRKLRDTDDILLVGEEPVYEFIAEMLRMASAPLRSRRIHIGMDEANRLGLGRYLKKNGYRRPGELMAEHLGRVHEIAREQGLEPMMWADMFFQTPAGVNAYMDKEAVVPDEMVARIPQDMQYVCWDYYHNTEEEYAAFIAKHRQLGSEIVFAGGIWTWHGVNVHYGKTFRSMNAALPACKKSGIQEVFAAMWGDNGSETNLFSALLGLQLFAEHGYSEVPDPERLKSRFRRCTGGDYDAFWSLSSLSELPGIDSDPLWTPSNPPKFLLWQDPLLGLFDVQAQLVDYPAHFARVEETLLAGGEHAGEWQTLFDTAARLAGVLKLKSHLGIEIKQHYDAGDREALERIATRTLTELGERLSELRIAHRQQWLWAYKPFGWEVLDLRYGGLLARIDSAAARITDYTQGRIARIEELEEERLHYDGPPDTSEPGRVLGFCNAYHRIVSASPLGVLS